MVIQQFHVLPSAHPGKCTLIPHQLFHLCPQPPHSDLCLFFLCFVSWSPHMSEIIGYLPRPVFWQQFTRSLGVGRWRRQPPSSPNYCEHLTPGDDGFGARTTLSVLTSCWYSTSKPHLLLLWDPRSHRSLLTSPTDAQMVLASSIFMSTVYTTAQEEKREFSPSQTIHSPNFISSSKGFLTWGRLSRDISSALLLHHTEGLGPCVPPWVRAENTTFVSYT